MNIKKVVVGELDTNCYILEKKDYCLIIDPGDDFELIKENIDKIVVGILITHSHFDHIGALDLIKDYYNVNVYDINNLNEGKNNIGIFDFDMVINLGHTIDSVSYIFDNNMFSGDFVFKNCIGRCDLGGDFELMKISISNLLNQKINYNIYPGHGLYTTLDDERYRLTYYIK